jgi:uncharacterized protein (DUF4415 family)
MVSRLPAIDAEGEVADLSEVDPNVFKPLSEMPDALQAKLRALRPGRPKAAETKERITIRLSPDVLRSFRATGQGWQTRVDAALREWLKEHRPG